MSFGLQGGRRDDGWRRAKKTAGFAGGFFGNFGCALRAINPLDPPAV
ncbi:hypothetical protein BURMUCF1_0439 [Burkholderia multivorans ATCC BAA-247]|nr:hypothetical protein BURMUCF1_0439 [Burkholderia multivorans ATCC BAA-247]